MCVQFGLVDVVCKWPALIASVNVFLCSDTYTTLSVGESTGCDASDSDQHVYVDPRHDAADSR